jgi:hypothetical protein
VGTRKATVLRAGRYRCQCTARKERSGDLAGCVSGGQAIDALFDIERDINGLSVEERLRVRQEQSAPLLTALET